MSSWVNRFITTMKGFSRKQDNLLKQAAAPSEKKDLSFTQSFMQEFDLKMQQWEREDNEARKASIRDQLDSKNPEPMSMATPREEKNPSKGENKEPMREKKVEDPNEFPAPEGIPFMVTMKMKKQLADLGYPPEVVKNFVPKDL